VVAGVLPPAAFQVYRQIEPFGFMILMALIASHIVSRLLEVPTALSIEAVLNIIGLR
jgi:hypothetical protein